MIENSTTPTPAHLCVAKTSNGRDAQNPGRLVGEGVSHPTKPYPFLSHECPRCNYLHMFKYGVCLNCNFRLDEAKEEIHVKLRRCRKNTPKTELRAETEGETASAFPLTTMETTKRGKHDQEKF